MDKRNLGLYAHVVMEGPKDTLHCDFEHMSRNNENLQAIIC